MSTTYQYFYKSHMQKIKNQYANCTKVAMCGYSNCTKVALCGYSNRTSHTSEKKGFINYFQISVINRCLESSVFQTWLVMTEWSGEGILLPLVFLSSCELPCLDEICDLWRHSKNIYFFLLIVNAPLSFRLLWLTDI